MTTIQKVSGNCLVMDGFSSRAPEVGMTLTMTDSSKTYVILTGQNGKLTLAGIDKVIEMGANSVLRIKGSTIVKPIKYKGSFDSAKLFIGRVWSKIQWGNEPFDKIITNSAVGVRG